MDQSAEHFRNSPESQDRDRQPSKIFFHTTLSRNVDSLMQQGLVSVKDRDVIGKDLMYSLTFGQEFKSSYVPREVNRQGNADQFSLTIWEDTPDIKQVNKFGKLRAGQYGPVKELSPDEEVPEGFWLSNMAGRHVDVSKLKKIDPEHFLAAIPIDRDTEYALALCKLQMTVRSRKVEDVEQILTNLLSSERLVLQPGYAVADLSQDLLFRMQQEALVHQTGPLVQEAIDGLNAPAEVDTRLLHAAIGELKAKQQAVNDEVGRRYLQMLEKKLKQAMDGEGLTERYDHIEPANISSTTGISKKVDPYQLWGGTNGYALVLRVAEDVRLHV
jgi:hypothetical protein